MADQPPTPTNKVFLQAFEWHTASSQSPNAPSHWLHLTRLLPSLALLGVTSIWIPPGCKANNSQGNGYDCYDLWDLGEFEQKGSRATKWGSWEELRDLLAACERASIRIMWDAVLNHKHAGDAVEECWAVEVNKDDRRVEIGDASKIRSWLKYDFSGRTTDDGLKYSNLRWRAEHFNGTDWDEVTAKNTIWKLIDDPATFTRPDPSAFKKVRGMQRFKGQLSRFSGSLSGPLFASAPSHERPGKGWALDVDKTLGNHDYLMFANIDHSHPEVRRDLIDWGRWMVNDIGVSSFRLDAAQHYSASFTKDWLAAVQTATRSKFDQDVFVVGEVFAAQLSRLTRWLDAVAPEGSPVRPLAFDTTLQFAFSEISEGVRTKSNKTGLHMLVVDPKDPEKRPLVCVRPAQALTLVTSHDTQPGQTCALPMDSRLKPLFYAYILLRQGGQPCVFWGDLYGTNGPLAEAPVSHLPQKKKTGEQTLPDFPTVPALMLARKYFGYGDQRDMITTGFCISWTRTSTHDRPGCVVVLNIGRQDAADWIVMGSLGRPKDILVDILQRPEDRIEIVLDKQGAAKLPCRSKSVSVYVCCSDEMARKMLDLFDSELNLWMGG